jgi:hypothetical protein
MTKAHENQSQEMEPQMLGSAQAGGILLINPEVRTGLRTTREGLALKLERSSAISIPEFPAPTTRTLRPL